MCNRNDSPVEVHVPNQTRKDAQRPGFLGHPFLKRETRKVRHDSTITIENNLFEVPPRFIGQNIQVRFDPHDLCEVFIYENGVKVARAKPVNFADNAKVKRNRPVLRLSDISEKMEE